MNKTCNECKESKPITEFFKDKAFKDGYYSRCKVCKTKATLQCRANKKEEYNAYQRQYRAEHPDTAANKSRDRRKSLRLRYGITQEQYDLILVAQEGRCALCPNTPLDKSFHTDHRHSDKEVRGILCPSCNRSMASIDDKEFLNRALEYDRNPPARIVLKKA